MQEETDLVLVQRRVRRSLGRLLSYGTIGASLWCGLGFVQPAQAIDPLTLYIGMKGVQALGSLIGNLADQSEEMAALHQKEMDLKTEQILNNTINISRQLAGISGQIESLREDMKKEFAAFDQSQIFNSSYALWQQSLALRDAVNSGELSAGSVTASMYANLVGELKLVYRFDTLSDEAAASPTMIAAANALASTLNIVLLAGTGAENQEVVKGAQTFLAREVSGLDHRLARIDEAGLLEKWRNQEVETYRGTLRQLQSATFGRVALPNWLAEEPQRVAGDEGSRACVYGDRQTEVVGTSTKSNADMALACSAAAWAVCGVTGWATMGVSCIAAWTACGATAQTERKVNVEEPYWTAYHTSIAFDGVQKTHAGETVFTFGVPGTMAWQAEKVKTEPVPLLCTQYKTPMPIVDAAQEIEKWNTTLQEGQLAAWRADIPFEADRLLKRTRTLLAQISERLASAAKPAQAQVPEKPGANPTAVSDDWAFRL